MNNRRMKMNERICRLIPLSILWCMKKITHSIGSRSSLWNPMQRLHLLPIVLVAGILPGCADRFPPVPSGRVIASEIRFRTETGESGVVRFLLTVPSRYDPRHSVPLVVVLHGGGDCAAAFHDLWKPVADSLGFALLTPEGGERMGDADGWTWGEQADPSIRACVDEAFRSVCLDRRRIYLAGFSAGGTLACRLGLAHTLVFGGFASLSSGFGGGTIPENPVLLRLPRVFIGFGELETEIGAASRGAAARLSALGAEVRLVSYPGTGHGLPEPVGEELKRILRFLDSGK
jgi:predicted esterase